MRDSQAAGLSADNTQAGLAVLSDTGTERRYLITNLSEEVRQ